MERPTKKQKDDPDFDWAIVYADIDWIKPENDTFSFPMFSDSQGHDAHDYYIDMRSAKKRERLYHFLDKGKGNKFCEKLKTLIDEHAILMLTFLLPCSEDFYSLLPEQMVLIEKAILQIFNETDMKTKYQNILRLFGVNIPWLSVLEGINNFEKIYSVRIQVLDSVVRELYEKHEIDGFLPRVQVFSYCTELNEPSLLADITRERRGYKRETHDYIPEILDWEYEEEKFPLPVEGEDEEEMSHVGDVPENMSTADTVIVGDDEEVENLSTADTINVWEDEEEE